jgi:hypothetical protein
MGRLELLQKRSQATDFDWEHDFTFPADDAQIGSKVLLVRHHKIVAVDDEDNVASAHFFLQSSAIKSASSKFSTRHDVAASDRFKLISKEGVKA